MKLDESIQRRFENAFLIGMGSESLGAIFGVDHWTVTDVQRKITDMTFRFTDVLTKKHGKWLVVHEHVSFPVDPATGAADFSSKP